MNEKPDWELVEEDPQPKQQFHQKGFSQKAFLYALLGRYPRVKLVGLAMAGILGVIVIALFSLIALAGATVVSILVLFAAWCRTKFSRSTKTYQVHPFGK